MTTRSFIGVVVVAAVIVEDNKEGAKTCIVLPVTRDNIDAKDTINDNDTNIAPIGSE